MAARMRICGVICSIAQPVMPRIMAASPAGGTPFIWMRTFFAPLAESTSMLHSAMLPDEDAISSTNVAVRTAAFQAWLPETHDLLCSPPVCEREEYGVE